MPQITLDTETIFAPPAHPPGRELNGHHARGGTTVHGGASILIGALPLLAGCYFLAGLAGLAAGVNPAVGIPRWVVACAAGMFVLAGLAFVVHGVRGIIAERRVRALREAHPREPWVWDHPWSAHHALDETRQEVRRAITFGGALAMLLLPFNWFAVAGDDVAWVLLLVTGIFDLLILGVLGRAVYLALRLARYGTTELRLPRFPCLAGEDLELRLVRTPALARLGAVEGTLRCVQERVERRGTGKERRSVVVCYELHAQTMTAEVSPDGAAFVFRFAPPATALGTALSERPPRYWELEVAGRVPGVDYGATFLVPVYARPQ